VCFWDVNTVCPCTYNIVGRCRAGKWSGKFTPSHRQKRIQWPHPWHFLVLGVREGDTYGDISCGNECVDEKCGDKKCQGMLQRQSCFLSARVAPNSPQSYLSPIRIDVRGERNCNCLVLYRMTASSSSLVDGNQRCKAKQNSKTRDSGQECYCYRSPQAAEYLWREIGEEA